MAAFDPVGSAPVASIGSASIPARAELTIAGQTPATTYVVATYFTPTYVAAGSVASTSAGSSINVPYPASGVAAGNIAFILVTEQTQGFSAAVLSAAAGWTQLCQFSTVSLWFGAIFYRMLDGTESGSVTISTTVGPGFNCAMAGMMHIWTNVDATTPFEGATSNIFNSGSNGSSQTMTGGSVTSTGPNRKFINLYMLIDNFVVASATSGSGWTDDLNSMAQYVSADFHGFIVDESAVAASPTTHAAESRAQSGRVYIYASLALIPATTRPTTFRPSVAALSLTGSANNVTANGTVMPSAAVLSLSGVRAFGPAPANLAVFGNTPTVVLPSGPDSGFVYLIC